MKQPVSFRTPVGGEESLIRDYFAKDILQKFRIYRDPSHAFGMTEWDDFRRAKDLW